MPTQKIPLFNGLIVPLPVSGDTVEVFTPPDKDLADGTQATYEVHLWVVYPTTGEDVPTIAITAQQASDPAVIVWQQSRSDIEDSVPAGVPAKVLDGYPVRGDVTLLASRTSIEGIAPGFAFGYYYRVGQGHLMQPERRFIGEALDGFNAGVPIKFVAGNRKIIHYFEKNRIDEISLAFCASTPSDSGFAVISFEDAANNPIPGTEDVFLAVGILEGANSVRDPQSVYTLFQIPLGGGGSPTLDHISISLNGLTTLTAHGYFTRH